MPITLDQIDPALLTVQELNHVNPNPTPRIMNFTASGRPLAFKTTARKTTGTVSGKSLPAPRTSNSNPNSNSNRPTQSSQPQNQNHRHRVGNKSLGGKTVYPGHPKYKQKLPRKKRRTKIVAPRPRFGLSKRGDGALYEIRHYQDRSFECLIPKAPFARLVKEIIQDVSHKYFDGTNFRVGRSVVEALQLASEVELTTLFICSNSISAHAKRITLLPIDLQLVLRLKNLLAPQLRIGI